MDYGVTNQRGVIPKNEIQEILRYCYQHNINTFDTAANYGNSEEILGELMPDYHLKIYSKIPHLNVTTICTDKLDDIENTFYNSLSKLRLNRIEGVFVHNANDLLAHNSDKLYQLFEKWKRLGLVQKIGLSVYDEEQVNSILNHFDFDMFQLPINIYDQRLIHSDILSKIKKRNIEIHARSIFLQGLLLVDSDKLPVQFNSFMPNHRKLESFLSLHGLTKLEGALHFISQIKQIDYMLVGINNFNHLVEIIQAYNNLTKKDIEFGDLQISNVSLIDPRRW